MGQIIDLNQWRARQSVGPRPDGTTWASTADAADLVTTSVGMWRSMMAAWAGMWLAPLGLLVSPVSTPARAAKDQRTACDPRR
jgi:hypothetical protein